VASALMTRENCGACENISKQRSLFFSLELAVSLMKSDARGFVINSIFDSFDNLSEKNHKFFLWDVQ
jgi:hypothetical protein